MSDSEYSVDDKTPGVRLNAFIAQATGMSRRAADNAIKENRVTVNNEPPTIGSRIHDGDAVTLDGSIISSQIHITIMLHKPLGYVCSRDGQGSKTIYDLLPPNLHQLKPVGRLDKNSSGLLLLTNDGALANELTHPRYHKIKIYEVELDKPLAPLHQQMINDIGVTLEDGVSKLTIDKHDEIGKSLKITMSEGRNRQIRRTFTALGYTVIKLHRTNFGTYSIGNLNSGEFIEI